MPPQPPAEPATPADAAAPPATPAAAPPSPDAATPPPAKRARKTPSKAKKGEAAAGADKAVVVATDATPAAPPCDGRPPPLADRPLDLETMQLRDIIKWSYARERARSDAERRSRSGAAAAAAAAEGGDGTPAPVDAAAAPTSPGALASPGALTVTSPGAMVVAGPPGPGAVGAGIGRPPLAPQVELRDGRIVVAQASLTVQAQPVASFTRVVEDAPVLNAATHAARLPNDRWTHADTELFYTALAQFGTDFSLMERVFPGRARRSLKNKFNRECRADGPRVDAALAAAARGGALESFRAIIALLAGDGRAAVPGGVPALEGLPAPPPGRGKGGAKARAAAAAAAAAASPTTITLAPTSAPEEVAPVVCPPGKPLAAGTPAVAVSDKHAARTAQRAAMRAAAAARRAGAAPVAALAAAEPPAEPRMTRARRGKA